MRRESEKYFLIVDMSRGKDQVWRQFTENDVGGTARAQCNMCERDVVPAERQFSTIGMSHGTLRSCLGVDEARKLSFLFKQLDNDDLEGKLKKNNFSKKTCFQK